MRSFHYLLSLVLLPVVTVSALRLAICDVGSNAIRFGVLGSLDRDLPHIFKERAPISLFEAQHMPEQGEDVEGGHEASASPLTLTLKDHRRPIAENVLKDVEASMSRFADIAKRHDAEFRIVATEASRTAHNSEELCKRITEATGVKVELLVKEEESRLSALGISATLYNPSGPSMDLGGGSLEINYLANGQDASVSGSGFLPQSIKCGSRVVGKRLNKEDETTVRDHVLNEIQVAKTAMLGNEKKCDGQTLYLTGGGFRAIGYIAMSYDAKYPFSTINGFTIGAKKLRMICTNFAKMDPDELKIELERVPSIRKDRYAQMPANFLIMLAAIEAMNPVDITFAEGGVRHGLAFTLMSEEEKQRDPLAASADRFTRKMGCAVSAEDQKQLAEYLSENDDVEEGSPASISPRLVDAAIRLVHLADDQTDNLFQLIKHAPLVGLTHQERAVLLLILIHRYGEDFVLGQRYGKRENLPLTEIKKLAGSEKIIRECERIGEHMRSMILQSMNVLGSVGRPDINAKPAIEVNSYATKLGLSVQDKEMEALGEWCSTYFLTVAKDEAVIPPLVNAAIELVHLAHAFGSDSQAAVAFEFIMRAQFVGLTKEDHAKLALILLYRYKGDFHSDAKGWDLKVILGKKPRKIRKLCQRFGKMLALAMEVNPTGDLEAKHIELRLAEEPNHMKVVVNNRKACGVDVPRIRKMLEKMEKHNLYIELDVSKAENDPISSSTSEAISPDAQSAKDPIASSTDEEILAASQSLENPSSSSTDKAASSDAPSAGEPAREKPCEWFAGFGWFGCD